mmetsp:Transcript_11315/g.31239  ORF Transcript_11315/g.31239 Transcript_11315/m.31239 type:complete len:509 (+) Transcript_11315:203-1729(+)
MLSYVFPVQRPRGLLEGCWNAVRTAVTGGLLSAASIVGAPLLGLSQVSENRIMGLVGGIIVGTIAGGTIAIGSTLNVLYNLLFGLGAAPRSWKAAWEGQLWDEDRREWIDYNLTREQEELEQRRTTARGPAKFNDLYDILGVAPSATPPEIKKAYRRKAKILHPDKNPNDETAQGEFLKLFEAYSTLNDETSRMEYDRYGTTSDGDSIVQSFDAKVFFAVLLDADAVEPFVGQLKVSSYVSKLQELVNLAQSSGDQTSIGTEAIQQFLQGWKDDNNRRYVDIASYLVSFVEDYESGKMTQDQFQIKSEQHVKTIHQTSVFGNQFLSLIGKALLREAREFQGYSQPYLHAPLALWTASLQFFEINRGRFDMANKTYSIATLLMELKAGNDKNGKRGDDANVLEGLDAESLQQALPSVLDLAWTFIASDIAHTLHRACLRVFRDSSVGRPQRQRRAQAVKRLGRAMLWQANKGENDQQTCLDKDGGKKMSAESLTARLERAYHLATMKAS